jgi:hypothetical protein
MGIYYGDVLGVRILRQIHTEAEYSEDYETLWEYEGPHWRELAKAKLLEFADDSLIVETKHEISTTMYDAHEQAYMWLSYTGL